MLSDMPIFGAMSAPLGGRKAPRIDLLLSWQWYAGRMTETKWWFSPLLQYPHPR
jgi:hypothetical protein